MYRATVVICMGASGSGKSTLAHALAERLGWRFIEGDDLHPQRNIDKMHRGEPLTDADRAPWLAAVAAEIDDCLRHGESAAISCSALRRSYRDCLRFGHGDLRFVYLRGSAALLEHRLRNRKGHFMPASLLQSQLQTLEPPASDELALTLDIDDHDLDALLVATLDWLPKL